MICPHCQTANPEHARFCINCGQPLPRVCPTCGAVNPPGARFCNQCGAPLTPSATQASQAVLSAPSAVPSGVATQAPAAPSQAHPLTTERGEADQRATPTHEATNDGAEETAEQRRVVTILFADLTGSTSLAEAMDPEDTRALLADFFAAMTRVIHRHGGTVEKYIGDAVMAVFGLPIAHEDDPVRAIRAALEMQTTLRALNAERRASEVSDPSAPELAMRIGVNTGEVVAAGDAGEGEDFLITGDAVNVASRLQQLAQPGAVLVGPRAYRGAQGAVRFRMLAPTTLRGKARATVIWEALAMLDASAVPTPRPRGLDGRRTPLVGREVEMELLRAISQRVLREWRPHVVTILGAPGVGKTRLAREFIRGLMRLASLDDLDLAAEAEAERDAERDDALVAASASAPAHAAPTTSGAASAATPAGGAHPAAGATQADGAASAELSRASYSGLWAARPPVAAPEHGVGEASPTDGVIPDANRPLLLEGRCPPYGEDITYWPLAEMLRLYCGVTALEKPERARAKILASVRRRFTAIGRTEDPEVIAAYLGHTIGVESAERRQALLPADSQQLQEGLLRAWRIFFEALADGRGLIAMIDDIHWADDALLDLIAYVAARASNVPLLFLCTARPELLERRPDWGGGRRNYAPIGLEALTTAETETLVQQLLPGDSVPERLRQSILAKADGNPFYVEEIIRMLVDRNVLIRAETPTADGATQWSVAPDWEASDEVSDPAIPDTVQGVLAARIDLLPPEERDVLQHAAVVGRYFWPSALLTLAAHLQSDPLERALQALQERDLVRPSERAAGLAAPPGEEVYTFNHALTREVVYSSIPRARRAHEHLRIAEWLERQVRDQPAEFAFTELLAQHYYRYYAQANLARSNNRERRRSMRGKVTRYLLLAGEQSVTRHALTKADGYYSDALSLLGDDGLREDAPRGVALLMRRGAERWLALRADDAWADYRTALRVWSAHTALATGVTQVVDDTEAPDMSGEGAGASTLVIPAERADAAGVAVADATPAGAVHAQPAVVTGAPTSVSQGVAAHEPLPADWREQGMRLYRLLAQLPTRNPGLFRRLPPHEELRGYLEAGLRMAEELGQRDTLDYAGLLTAKSFFWWSWAEQRSERELLDAYRSAREAVRIAETLGDPRAASEALDALGNIQSITTDLRGYLESQTRRLDWARQIDDPSELVDIYGEVSQAQMMVGSYAEAVQYAQAAVALVNEAELDALRSQALQRLVLADFEWDHWSAALQAGDEFQQRLARAGTSPSRHYLWARLTLAIIYARTGDADNAERLERIVAEQPPSYPAQYIEVARARLLLARGATDDARQTLLTALDTRSGRHSMATLVAELAELAARTGDTELYGRFGAQALELGWRSGARKALAQATRARAIVALAEGRWDDALADAQSALTRYRDLGTTWEEARSRYVLASLYRRRADPDDEARAHEELSQALALFEALHAVRDIARARAALAGGDVRLP